MTKIDQVIDLLTEIRDLMAGGDEPIREVDEQGNCLHPEHARELFGHKEWICRLCRFHECQE